MSVIGSIIGAAGGLADLFLGSPNTSVIIEPIDDGPMKSSWVPENQPDAIYVDYMIDSSYEESPHTYMAGVTSPDGFDNNQAAFFQLAATTKLWVVRWTALRLNKKPEVPAKLSDTNWVYLGGKLEPFMLGILPTGNGTLWRLSGTYYYGAKNPGDNIEDNTAFPIVPFLQQAFNRSLPKEMFVGKLLQTPQQTATGSTTAPTPRTTVNVLPTPPVKVEKDFNIKRDDTAGIVSPISPISIGDTLANPL